MSEPILAFRITKSYPGFSLECEAAFDAGISAVFGPTGSGKTTLLNCIAGLASPDRGEIRVFGETIYSSAGRDKRRPEKRRFGYVFQDSVLFPHMSVWRNIRYGYKLVPARHRRIEPERLVELFHLSGLLDRGVSSLSGGERQKVALARALAISPRLLLLDEPLASVDMAFRGLIIRYLKRVWRELHIPIIYVSHSLSEVMALAEEVLVLSDGTPIAQGRPSQVLVSPRVSAVADYATLQNLLDAEVVSPAGEDGLATLAVGSVRVSAPDVRSEPGEQVTVSIDASDIILALEVPSRISAQNIVGGKVEEVHSVGTRVLVYVDIGTRLVVEITMGALRDLGLQEGQDVYLIIKSNGIQVLEAPAEVSSDAGL